MLRCMTNFWHQPTSWAGALIASAFLLSGCASSSPPRQKNAFNEQLASVLYRLAERDQQARHSSMANADPTMLRGTVQRIDKENTEELRAIVKRFGWPGRSLVGQRGANAAWMVVQHADHDRAFQKQCLKLMEAAPDGEVSKEDVAFLTDRVLLADGKKQRYGTQFKQVGGRFVPQPLEDEANVDERRKKVGLPPLAEYAKQLSELYRSR